MNLCTMPLEALLSLASKANESPNVTADQVLALVQQARPLEPATDSAPEALSDVQDGPLPPAKPE